MKKLLASLGVFACCFVFMVALMGAASSNCGDAEASSDGSLVLGPPGSGTYVGFSEFGGPKDPGTGHTGYRGDNLEKLPDSFAELSNNYTAPLADLDYKAMGGLDHNEALRVTGPKGSIILKKRDVGRGGVPVGSPPTKRGIDLWYSAAAKIGVGGTGRVRVEKVSSTTAKTSTTAEFRSFARANANTKMTRPTTGTLTSPFGQRWGRLHAGVDIGASTGTPIVAALAGTVSFAGPAGGYGNYTCLRHSSKLTTCYGHQSKFAKGIRSGTAVAQGQLIGYVGNTDASTGPHLHFEVRLGADRTSRPVDPSPYLEGSVAADPSAVQATEDSAEGCAAEAPPTGQGYTGIVQWAEWLDRQRYPYCYGGGHVTPARPTTGQYCWSADGRQIHGSPDKGYDCSSSTSFILQKAGFKVDTMVSGAYESWGEPGEGKFVTIWANAEHVFLTIKTPSGATRSFSTSVMNYRHGPGFVPTSKRPTAGFVARHPKGL